MGEIESLLGCRVIPVISECRIRYVKVSRLILFRSKIYEAQEQKVFERRHHYCNLQAMADAEEAAREKEEK